METQKTSPKNVKFCLALNYLVTTNPLQAKDSGRVFDEYLDETRKDAVPGLVSKIIRELDNKPDRILAANVGLSHDNFINSLEHQLQGVYHRKAMYDVASPFIGAVVFTLDDREVDGIYKNFPHHQGTLKVFNTYKNRAWEILAIRDKFLAINQEKDSYSPHLDA
ncbi:MAG: hypothetical protein ACRBDI_03440 [Alphaproteobacteria bacterium]